MSVPAGLSIAAFSFWPAPIVIEYRIGYDRFRGAEHEVRSYGFVYGTWYIIVTPI
jgi:hypothetical protein